MKIKHIIPLFLFCTLLYTSNAQTTKEWYFFGGQYTASIKNYNSNYVNPVVSHDSLLFGFINNDGFYAYKATHHQGLVKKTRFNFIYYVEAIDMCIDSSARNIYILGKTGQRPPLNKFCNGIIYKLDYDLNKLDSVIISYSTMYNPYQITLFNHKLYIAGANANYFSEPGKVNIAIVNLNLTLLNLKVISDSVCSRIPLKMLINNNQNLVIYTSRTSSLSAYNKITVDTNLNVLLTNCVLNNCNYALPFNILKDANGFTYSFDEQIYNPNITPVTEQYHVRVNENEDTIQSTFFVKSYNPSGMATGYTYDRINHLQKNKNNGYIGLGCLVSPPNYNLSTKPTKFYIIDSTLKIINQFDVLNFTTAKLETTTPGKIKIGQTESGMYYVVGEAKDSTQTNYKGVFYLMSIDSTAKIVVPPTTTITPTVTPETIWENITIYPNPTNDVVTIALPPNSNYNINIYNTLGQQLIGFNDVSNNRQISLANLPTGVYHFTFYETLLKKGITKKVVVQR